MKNCNIFITLITLFFIQVFGKNPDEDIIILYTNDVHCAINETIGYAGLSYYKQEVNKKTPYVSLVDAGDHVQGGTIGTISSGKYLIDIMNAVVYDVATPGNHEFDYGMDQFLFFAKNLSCSYVSCNFRDMRTGKLVFKPYSILEYGDVKVAFVGISTPESISKSVPSSFMDENGNYIYGFDGDAKGEKLVASVQEAVNSARDEGADFVIAVGHLGENGDFTKVWSAPYVVERTSGIDAFIDGHTHEFTECFLQKNLEGKEVPITQSGTRLVKIGQVTIGKDGSVRTKLIDAADVKSKDERILKLIEEIQSSYNEKLNEVIGYVGFELQMDDRDGNRIIRRNESNLSDLITDSFLNESKNYGGADIALCNGGNIRSPIKPGNITYGNAIEVLPFLNQACIVEMPGQSILDGLEMSARKYPEENGGFLHSSGLTYAIDPDIPSSVVIDGSTNKFLNITGERRIHSVFINGEPIDPQKRYKVIGDKYPLVEHGDGYDFEGMTVVNTDFALPSDLLINYIKKLGNGIEKYREPQKRIIFSKKPIINNNDNNLKSKISLQIEGFEELDLLINEKFRDSKSFPEDKDNFSEKKYKISNGVEALNYDDKDEILKFKSKK